MNLIADIGGTNARLALSVGSGPVAQTIRSYRNDDFDSFEDILSEYLSSVSDGPVTGMVVAVAGPVTGRTGRLTNRDWSLSSDHLEQRFGVDRAEIINDLTALGYAVPYLQKELLQSLVGDDTGPKTGQPMLVVGIGTGFNVSPVIPVGDRIVCPSVEAGHASMPYGVVLQGEKWISGFGQAFPTIEHLFSGRGLRRFLDLTQAKMGEDVKAQIASEGTDDGKAALSQMDLYAMLMGHLVRDLSMTYLPTGGIFLAGGVARSIVSATAMHHSVDVLRSPSRFLANPPPVWLIVEDSAALFGCAYVAALP